MGDDHKQEDLAAVRSRWEELGRDDPMWAVLTEADKRGGAWDLDAFLRTGEGEVEGVLAALDRMNIPVRRGRALDFGCGIGRLTQALAGHFDQATGVDVATSMIDEARRVNRRGARCSFLVNSRSDLSQFPDANFDLVYSCRVLQHMPPALGAEYLVEFLRVLAPGGVAVFQVPSEPKRTLKGYLIRWVPGPLVDRLRKMQMHGTMPSRIRAIVEAGDAELLDVSSDDSAGSNWVSFRYITRKR